MLTTDAKKTATERYKRWLKLLKDELEMVKEPGGHVIAIGGKVSQFLSKSNIGHYTVSHYSPVVNGHFSRFAAMYGREFETFRKTIHKSDVIELAEMLMREARFSDALHAKRIAELQEKEFSEGDMKVVFRYSKEFSTVGAAT